MYCDGSITIRWSLDVFINDFPLTWRRVKNQSYQVMRVRPAPAAHLIKVFFILC